MGPKSERDRSVVGDAVSPDGGRRPGRPGLAALRTARNHGQRSAVALVAGAALVAAIIEYARTGSPGEALEAVVGGALAGAVAALALSLPGARWRGAVIGACFISNGLLSTTFLDRPEVVWGALLVQGLLLALLSWPWLRNLRFSVRMGSAWLGVSYWLLGIVAALAIGSAGVGAQRLAYAGMLGLAVLAVLAGTRRDEHSTNGHRTNEHSTNEERAGGRDLIRDLSGGIAVAFLVAVALLLLAGAGAIFDRSGPVPAGIGADQGSRFWGGPWLLYHPNSMAGLSVAVAIRVGIGHTYAWWQRLAATAVAGLVVYLTESRTALVFLGAAGVIHAALLWWQHRAERTGPDARRVHGLPGYGTARQALAAAATPFVVLLLVGIISGGGLLFKQRYVEGGVTSGRTATWGTVVTEWRDDGIPEKLFGHANDARATVNRGPKSDVAAADKLPTDNALVGALRRGGVLGVLAFLVGLVLLIRHALLRPAPAWFVVVTIAALPTIATTDWLLGGTGGVLWILLVAGEAATALALAAARAKPD